MKNKHQGYDKYIVFFSGGKDSIALVLHLLEMDIPKSKIELWHHDIDGREGEQLMDWSCTPAYCQAFADALGIVLYFSWRRGGFEAEMLREKSYTGGVSFEDPEGVVHLESSKQDRYKNTRLKFPQVSADLSVRWCSAYLKIDVAGTVMRNSPRLRGLKVLGLSGERGEESDPKFLEKSPEERRGRGKYKLLEIDIRADLRKGKKKENRRWISRARPIRDWQEQQVWEIIERWKIRLHPAYYLGFSRLSCFACIFGDKNQFASGNIIYPEPIKKICGYEKQFDTTIKRKESIEELIEKGTPYKEIENNPEHLADARKETYDREILMKQGWTLPAGAFKGGSCGAI